MDISFLTDPTKLLNKDKIVTGLKSFQKTLRTDAEVKADGEALKIETPETPAYKPGMLMDDQFKQIGESLTKPFTDIQTPVEAAQAISPIFKEGGFDLTGFGFGEMPHPTEEEKARGEALFKPAAEWLSDRGKEVEYVFTQPNFLSEGVRTTGEFVNKGISQVSSIFPAQETKITIDKYSYEDIYKAKVNEWKNAGSTQSAWNWIADPSYRAWVTVKESAGNKAVESYANFINTLETNPGITKEVFKTAAMTSNYIIDMLERPIRKIALPHYYNFMFNLATFLRHGKITKEDFERNKLAAGQVAGGPVDYLPDLITTTSQFYSNPVAFFNQSKKVVDEMLETETGYRERMKKDHPELVAWEQQEIFGIPMLSLFDTITSYAAGLGEAIITPYMTQLGLMTNSKHILGAAKVVSMAQQTTYPVALTVFAANNGWLGADMKQFIDEESAKDPNFGQSMSVLSGVAVLSTFFKGAGMVLKPFKKVSLLDQLQSFEKQYEDANGDPGVVDKMIEDFRNKFLQNVEVYKRGELGKSGGITAEQINELFNQWGKLPVAIRTKMQDLTLRLFYRMAEESSVAGYYKEQAKILGLNTDTLTTKYGNDVEAGQVVYHEFAHAIERGVMNDPILGPVWKSLTSQVAFENVKGTTQPAKTFGEYKYANPGEYFAENFRMFSKNPAMLLETDPAMYEFMGKVNSRIGGAMVGGGGGESFAPRTEGATEDLMDASNALKEYPIIRSDSDTMVSRMAKRLGIPTDKVLTDAQIKKVSDAFLKQAKNAGDYEFVRQNRIIQAYNKVYGTEYTKWEQIPNEIPVYRGAQNETDILKTGGYGEGERSYTLDKKIADTFAGGESEIPGAQVRKYTINKNNIPWVAVEPYKEMAIHYGDLEGTQFSPRQIPEELKPLYEEAKKYKSAEEFIEAKQEQELGKFDQETINEIQKTRHELHSMSSKSLYLTESSAYRDFDEDINFIADRIDELNITGKESEVSQKLRSFAEDLNRPSDADFELDEKYNELVELRDKDGLSDAERTARADAVDEYMDKLASKGMSYISNQKEEINNIIEDYLGELDRAWDKYKLDDVSDMRDGKTFRPSGYARARSLLGDGAENTATEKYHDDDVDNLRKIWELAQKNTPEAEINQRDVSAMPRYKSPEGNDVDLQAFTYKSRNGNNISEGDSIVNKTGGNEEITPGKISEAAARKAEMADKLNPLYAEAKKYKSAEEFVSRAKEINSSVAFAEGKLSPVESQLSNITSGSKSEVDFNNKLTDIWNKANGGTEYMPRVSGKNFQEAVTPTAEKFPDSITKYTVDDYNRMMTVLNEEGTSGYALKDDGEVVSVFRDQDFGTKGEGELAIVNAVENGARRLDVLNTAVADLYLKVGFEEIKREPNWTKGKPDVIFMNLNEAKYEAYRRKYPENIARSKEVFERGVGGGGLRNSPIRDVLVKKGGVQPEGGSANGTEFSPRLKSGEKIAFPSGKEGFDVDTYIKELTNKRIEASKGSVQKKMASLAKDFLADVKAKVIDYAAPIEDAIKSAKSKYQFDVMPKSDITAQIDRAIRAPTLAGQFMEDYGLAEVIRRAPDLNKLDQYLIARQALDVSGKGIETGRDLVKDRLLVKTLGPEYEFYAQRVTNYSRRILDYAVDSGLISKNLSDNLKRKYPDYVPLNRVFSESEQIGGYRSGSGIASLSKQNIVQKLEGSTREIENPIESLLLKTNELFSEGEKNKAASIISKWSTLPGLKDEIIPLRTAENVQERMDIFSALKKSRPIRDKLERLITTREKWARQIGSELNKLNREGVDAYLKRKPGLEKPDIQSSLQEKRTIKQGTVVTDTDTFKRSYVDKVELETLGAIPTRQQVKDLINKLFVEYPDGVGIIKKKIGTRDKYINSILGELESLQSKLEDVNNMRKGLVDEAKLLKDAEAKGKSTISVYKNGIKEIYEVPPDIAEAAKRLNVEQHGILLKILQTPVRIFKAGTTGLEPSFIASNVVKDQLTAFINSNNSLKTSLANPRVFIRSLFSVLKHDDLYKELVREGAGGTSMDISRPQISQTVMRIRAGRDLPSRIGYTVLHPSEMLRYIEDIVGRSEEMARMTQYLGTKQALLTQGRTLDDAIILASNAARQNTANFYRKGEWGNVINSVPYLNAGIQGARAFIRSASRNPAGTAFKTVTTLFLPVAAATAWNLSDETRRRAYMDIMEYEKEGNFVIIPPNPVKDERTGKWNVVKVPMPPGIANLSIPVRRAIEQAQGLDPVRFQEVARAIIGTVSPINPIGQEDFIDWNQILSSLTPQIIKPAIEVVTNKSLFTGGTVVPQSLQGVSPKNQVKKSTSLMARILGERLNVSPIQIDYLIRGYGGKLASELTGSLSPMEAISGRFTQASGGMEVEKAYNAERKASVENADYNLEIRNTVDRLIEAKDGAGLKKYEESLPDDKRTYMKKYFKDKMNNKSGELENVISGFNGATAIKYYEIQIDDAIRAKDNEQLIKIVESVDSNKAKGELSDYIKARIKQLSAS